MENSKSNLSKLKSFKTIQENFAVEGINPKLVTQSYPFNGKNFAGFLLLISGTISLYVYIFNYAFAMTLN